MQPAPHPPDRRSERRPTPPTTLVAAAHRAERLRRTCSGVGTFLAYRSVAGLVADGPLAGIRVVPPGGGTFVPVFRADEPAAAEQRRLAERFPGAVAAPLCHHVATGRVAPFHPAR